MPQINQLPLLGQVQSGDQIPVYTPENGDARRMPINLLRQYLAGFFEPISTGVQVINGSGAVSVTTPTTSYISVGVGDALTLADGTNGQLKNIVYVAEANAGDTGILTPANFGNGSTVTFNSVGNSVQLQFLSGEWWVVSLYGAVVA